MAIDTNKDEDVSEGTAQGSGFAETILDAISPHIAIVDSAGKIIKVNSAWHRFAEENGMPPGRDGVGENYFDICKKPAARDFVARAAIEGIKAVLSGKKSDFTLEYPCHSPAKKRWFLMRVRPLHEIGGAVISHDDISPLKAAELALQESRDNALYTSKKLAERELFLNTLAENLPGMVGYWDVNLRCLFANKHYLEWFGIPAKKMIGITIRELMGDELFAKNEPFIRGALQGDDQTFERELLRADGSIGHTLARYIVDKDEYGRVKGFLALVTDVSLLKQAESDLKTANDSLLLACESSESANLAKSRFLATMSHELRTPLHTIIGFSEVLLDTRYNNPCISQCSEYITDIHTSAKHLLDVVNDVLDIAKIESGRMEIVLAPISVGIVIAGVGRLLIETAHKARIAFETFTPPDLPDVLADEQAIKQILFNLISNALKFTPAGGSIIVFASHSEDGVDIVVKDTGVGIPHDQLDRVQRPFEQMDNNYTRSLKGTGLGLSVVQGLVKMHGGFLTIKSDVGIGTTITIHLPHRPRTQTE